MSCNLSKNQFEICHLCRQHYNFTAHPSHHRPKSLCHYQAHGCETSSHWSSVGTILGDASTAPKDSEDQGLEGMARSHVFMAPKTISSLPELHCQGTGLFHLDFASGNASAENEPLQLSWWKSAPLYHSCRRSLYAESVTWDTDLEVLFFIGLGLQPFMHQAASSSKFTTSIQPVLNSCDERCHVWKVHAKHLHILLQQQTNEIPTQMTSTNNKVRICWDESASILHRYCNPFEFKVWWTRIQIFWLLLSQFSNTCLTPYIKFLHGPTDPSAQRFWHPPAASRRPTAREPPIEGAAQCGYCHALWPHNPEGTRKQRPWKFDTVSFWLTVGSFTTYDPVTHWKSEVSWPPRTEAVAGSSIPSAKKWRTSGLRLSKRLSHRRMQSQYLLMQSRICLSPLQNLSWGNFYLEFTGTTRENEK